MNARIYGGDRLVKGRWVLFGMPDNVGVDRQQGVLIINAGDSVEPASKTGLARR
jgi:hypothetical protein